MKKTDGFRVYFSNFLENNYSLNKEQINGYLEIKEKQERFDNRKLIGSLVGVGELISAAIMSIIDGNNNLSIPIVILGSVGFLTAKISVTRNNPYYLKEYKEIDKIYYIKKLSYKKTQRKRK